MADTPRHSVSVAGIVVNESGEVLIIRRRDNGHWEPPGGVLELTETIEEGVRREILEETGISTQVERLTGVYKNMKRGIVALVYRCTPLNESGGPTVEAAEIRWAAPEDAIDMMTPAYAIRVADALETGPFTRAHDGVHTIPSEHE
ncbi:NUDIX hydrolase [Saccharothrix sp. S26]|uniref:NUDIX hydrolase n=1 Tax=Saccharothrix sp. S26 TaxID=2907215 RepID=UPI001F1E2BF9|nr:NUDIX hydrolase [Saccharothrix sp. S26]MCE6994464.1 NUDIX hydrolase [Saccharothrix sp. S26]